MKRNIYYIFFMVTIMLIMFNGCANSNKGGHVTNRQQKETENLNQIRGYNEIIELGLLQIKIIDVSLIKNSEQATEVNQGNIAFWLEIENISSEETEFYPEDLEISLNTGEVSTPDPNLTSSFLGGTYSPEKIQKGFITFPIKKSELNSIKELQLKIPIPVSKDHQSPTEVREITIPLDKLELMNN